jgi:hypothetical protein
MKVKLIPTIIKTLGRDFNAFKPIKIVNINCKGKIILIKCVKIVQNVGRQYTNPGTSAIQMNNSNNYADAKSGILITNDIYICIDQDRD